MHRGDKANVIRAVLADFGFARLNPDLNDNRNSQIGLAASTMTAVVVAPGYIDPLYVDSNQVSPIQDIYA